MTSWRATLRWTSDRQRYHVEDVEAPDFMAALAMVRAAIPADVAAGADLLELRRQTTPEQREHGPA